MACNRYIYACSFILVVIAAHVIPIAESRQLKVLKRQKLNSFAGEGGLSDHGKKTMEENDIPAGPEQAFHVAPPTPSDDIVLGGAVTSPSTSTNRNPVFGAMASTSTTDFKPTAPGNSPGVGHSFVGNEQDDQQKPPSSHSAAHTLSSSPDDFKPTTPGRSPGVGHSFQTMKKEPNA